MTMDQFEGRTAVVTGAASGIGRALAERFAAAKMRVVLADVEAAPLHEVEDALLERGADVLAVEMDVRKPDSMDDLHRRATGAYGNVHILCNNAGVSTGGPMWELSTADWEWTLGVNLWGVINGIRAFLPGMLAHGESGHIVNTSSVAGLVGAPFQAAYIASKFGIIGVSEALFYELHAVGASVGVSVLCPGFVNTRIIEAVRNFPPEFGPRPTISADDATEALREAMAASMPPTDVAESTFQAIRANQFWILTHHEFDPSLRLHAEAMLARHNPPILGVG